MHLVKKLRNLNLEEPYLPIMLQTRGLITILKIKAFFFWWKWPRYFEVHCRIAK